jgi:hypothetical protein
MTRESRTARAYTSLPELPQAVLPQAVAAVDLRIETMLWTTWTPGT